MNDLRNLIRQLMLEANWEELSKKDMKALGFKKRERETIKDNQKTYKKFKKNQKRWDKYVAKIQKKVDKKEMEKGVSNQEQAPNPSADIKNYDPETGEQIKNYDPETGEQITGQLGKWEGQKKSISRNDFNSGIQAAGMGASQSDVLANILNNLDLVTVTEGLYHQFSLLDLLYEKTVRDDIALAIPGETPPKVAKSLKKSLQNAKVIAYLKSLGINLDKETD